MGNCMVCLHWQDGKVFGFNRRILSIFVAFQYRMLSVLRSISVCLVILVVLCYCWLDEVHGAQVESERNTISLKLTDFLICLRLLNHRT